MILGGKWARFVSGSGSGLSSPGVSCCEVDVVGEVLILAKCECRKREGGVERGDLRGTQGRRRNETQL